MKTNTHFSKIRKTTTRRVITGQGMTEYIIVLALVALTAVVAVGYFGDAIQGQFVAMGQKLTGEASTGLTDGNTNKDDAITSTKLEEGLKTYTE